MAITLKRRILSVEEEDVLAPRPSSGIKIKRRTIPAAPAPFAGKQQIPSVEAHAVKSALAAITQPIFKGLAKPTTKPVQYRDPMGEIYELPTETQDIVNRQMIAAAHGALPIFPTKEVEPIIREHPIAHAAGSLAGLIGVGKFTGGVYPSVANAKMLESLPTVARAAAGRMAQTGVTFGVKKFIDLMAEQVGGKDRSKVEILKGTLGDTLFGAGLGAAGTIPAPLIRIPSEAAYGFATAKIQGADNLNAGIQGAVFGLFGLFNRQNLNKAYLAASVDGAKRATVDSLVKSKRYTKAQAQPIVDRFYRWLAIRTNGFSGKGIRDFDKLKKDIRAYNWEAKKPAAEVKKLGVEVRPPAPEVRQPAAIEDWFWKKMTPDQQAQAAGVPERPALEKPKFVGKAIQPVKAARWTWGAEPAAAIPGEPIEFLDADENLENAKAALFVNEEGKYYVTRDDGTKVYNPKTESALFDTAEEVKKIAEKEEAVPKKMIDWEKYKEQYPEAPLFKGEAVQEPVKEEELAKEAEDLITAETIKKYQGKPKRILAAAVDNLRKQNTKESQIKVAAIESLGVVRKDVIAPGDKEGVSVASKIRESADNMEKQIQEKLSPASAQQAPTVRRAAMASSMIADGEFLQDIQSIMRNIAGMIESKTLPEEIKGITTKSQIEYILRRGMPERGVNSHAFDDVMKSIKGKAGSVKLKEDLGHVSKSGWRYLLTEHQVEVYKEIVALAKKTGAKGYYISNALNDIRDYDRIAKIGITTKEQFDKAKETLSGLTREITPEEIRAKELKKLEESLIGTKIPGFFATPKPLIEGMIESADLKEGLTILEPSAGKGDIADAIKAEGHEVDVVEISPTLASILKAKEHNVVSSDFLTYEGKYDRIIMNPPFEKGQDMDHVKHAYSLLNPGGKVIAIMGEGSFGRSDKKALAFKKWFDEVGGVDEKHDPGSFKKAFRSTGVSTRAVIIEKPGKRKVKPEEPVKFAGAAIKKKELPPHLQKLVEEKPVITDVTPEGYGPEKKPEPKKFVGKAVEKPVEARPPTVKEAVEPIPTKKPKGEFIYPPVAEAKIVVPDTTLKGTGDVTIKQLELFKDFIPPPDKGTTDQDLVDPAFLKQPKKKTTILQYFTPAEYHLKQLGFDTKIGKPIRESLQDFSIELAQKNDMINKTRKEHAEGVRKFKGEHKKIKYNMKSSGKLIWRMMNEGIPEGDTSIEAQVARKYRKGTEEMLVRMNKTREIIGMPPIQGVKNYILHMLKPEFLNEIYSRGILPTELAKAMEYIPPKKVFLRTAIERKGVPEEWLTKDPHVLMRAMYAIDLKYIHLQTSLNKVDPYLKAVKHHKGESFLDEWSPETYKYLDDWIKQAIKMRPSNFDVLIDNLLEYTIAPVLRATGLRVSHMPWRDFVSMMSAGAHTGALGMRLKPVLRNMVQSTFDWVMYGTEAYTKGSAAFMTPGGFKILRESKVWKTRMPFEAQDSAFIHKVFKTGAIGYRMADLHNVGKGILTRYYHAKDKLGYSHEKAIAFADDDLPGTQWSYRREDLPRAYWTTTGRAVWTLGSWWMNFYNRFLPEIVNKTFKGVDVNGRKVPVVERLAGMRLIILIGMLYGIKFASKELLGITIDYTGQVKPTPMRGSPMASVASAMINISQGITDGDDRKLKKGMRDLQYTSGIFVPYWLAVNELFDVITGKREWQEVTFYGNKRKKKVRKRKKKGPLPPLPPIKFSGMPKRF